MVAIDSARKESSSCGLTIQYWLEGLSDNDLAWWHKRRYRSYRCQRVLRLRPISMDDGARSVDHYSDLFRTKRRVVHSDSSHDNIVLISNRSDICGQRLFHLRPLFLEWIVPGFYLIACKFIPSHLILAKDCILSFRFALCLYGCPLFRTTSRRLTSMIFHKTV